MKKYHIGYTCGVFDLFHVGHLNLLERCKEMCDILIVGVCDDKYVTEIKKKQPVYPEDQRMRILNALKVVDRAELVTIEETDDKMLALKKFGFDVLFSGDDWKGSERYMRTEKQFAEYGASIEYLPYTHGISTTEIKEKMKEQKVESRWYLKKRIFYFPKLKIIESGQLLHVINSHHNLNTGKMCKNISEMKYLHII